MNRQRARGVLAALLVIGWVTTVSASCGRPAGRPAGKPPSPAGARVAAGEGKGGTQLDFSQPRPRSRPAARQAAATIVAVDPTAQPLQGTDSRIGALFEQDASGFHFCTASVVPSPGHDLVMTAAHCINNGRGRDNTSIVFIPGYADGVGPYGVWTTRAVIVDPQWAKGGDPDDDIGFVVLNRNDGENIQDAVGANTIEFNAGYSHLVRVTGYPGKDDAPVTCENWTTKYSGAQLRFACGGFYAGTSGSPWIAASPGAVAHPPMVVGVIGGYQRGGDISSVSYSVYLGSAIEQLYQQAEAVSAG
jgi:V8-like Glu-specific endopeptidase